MAADRRIMVKGRKRERQMSLMNKNWWSVVSGHMVGPYVL